MTEIILQQIAENINQGCLFLTKPCGVARPQRERVEKKVKIYPVIRNYAPDTCNKQPYIAMTPSTSDAVIAYFEVLNTRSSEVNQYSYIANIRLVGWINQKRIENYLPGTIEGNLMKVIANSPLSLPTGLTIRYCEPRSFAPKLPDIFSKYTYDETETQYLMFPFDFFAIHYEIGFQYNPNCVAAVVLSNAVTC